MLPESIRKIIRPLVVNKHISKLIKYVEQLKYIDTKVLSNQKGNHRLYDAVISNNPLSIGKLGSVELLAICNYLRCQMNFDCDNLTAKNRQTLFTNAGVYPNTYQTLQQYSTLMLDKILPEMDIMGIWYNWGESKVIKKYCNNTEFITLDAFASYHWNIPWTKALEGKQVLVVHPFVNSIEKQYLKRENIWQNNPVILPDFNLKLLSVPFSPALLPPKIESWFDTLDMLKNKMSKIEFDIALIGAGAYSLPLAVYAKQLGRQGIHTGGETQFYFGIKGGRWDKMSSHNMFYNKYWIRPLPEDTPTNNSVIEHGCYW
jgi:hypothetical protein